LLDYWFLTDDEFAGTEEQPFVLILVLLDYWFLTLPEITTVLTDTKCLNPCFAGLLVSDRKVSPKACQS